VIFHEHSAGELYPPEWHSAAQGFEPLGFIILFGNLRLSGIAGSPDGTRIWVTVTGHFSSPGHLIGAVLELPAF
jgi:hypothetical protein